MQYILWILSIQNIFCVCATFSEQILNAICHIQLPLIIAIVSIISVSVDYEVPTTTIWSKSQLTSHRGPQSIQNKSHLGSHLDDRNSPPGWSSHGIKAQGTQSWLLPIQGLLLWGKCSGIEMTVDLKLISLFGGVSSKLCKEWHVDTACSVAHRFPFIFNLFPFHTGFHFSITWSTDDQLVINW